MIRLWFLFMAAIVALIFLMFSGCAWTGLIDDNGKWPSGREYHNEYDSAGNGTRPGDKLERWAIRSVNRQRPPSIFEHKPEEYR